MPVSGVFFLPGSTASISTDTAPYQVLLTSLKTHYNVKPLPGWRLDHRLFRGSPLEESLEASSSGDTIKSQSSRHLQLLSISTLPEHSFVVTTTTSGISQIRAGTSATASSANETVAEPAHIIQIPSGASSEDFTQLVLARLGPLWQPKQVLQVTQGQAFEVGDFRLLVGEVRQGQGSSQQVKGVVMSIEWLSGDEGDWEIGGQILKSFWAALEIKGARDYINVTGVREGFASVKQWCEALRLRL